MGSNSDSSQCNGSSGITLLASISQWSSCSNPSPFHTQRRIMNAAASTFPLEFTITFQLFRNCLVILPYMHSPTSHGPHV